MFEVNELYKYGRLVSVVLGNCILTFSNIMYILYTLLINVFVLFRIVSISTVLIF